MSVIGFYTEDGKRKPITARRRTVFKKPRRRHISSSMAVEALKKEFPDVSANTVFTGKVVVSIFEEKPHPGDCNFCDACKKRVREVENRAKELLKASYLAKRFPDFKHEVMVIFKPGRGEK